MSSRELPRRLLVVTCLIGVGLVAVDLARAEIYRYEDEQGRIHLTDSSDKIPLRYQGRAQEISGRISRNDSLNVVPGMNQPPLVAGEEGARPVPQSAKPFTFQSIPSAMPGASKFQFQIGDPIVSGPASWLLGLLFGGLVFVLNALVLRLACRLCGEDQPSIARACAIFVLQAIANLGATVVMLLVTMLIGGMGFMQSSLASLLYLGVALLVNGRVLASMIGLELKRGVLVVVVHTVLSVLFFIVPAVVIGMATAVLSVGTG